MRFVPEAAEAPAFPAAAEALLPADCWLQAANTAAAIKLNKAVRRVNIFHLLLLLMKYLLKNIAFFKKSVIIYKIHRFVYGWLTQKYQINWNLIIQIFLIQQFYTVFQS